VLNRLARSSLLHFVVLGALIFAVAPRARAGRRTVFVSSKIVAELQRVEAQRLGVPLLPEARAREVEARAIEDELLYREAIRLSFDREDPLVKQRLVQKHLLLVEDLGGASRAPTEPELRDYFEETRDRWQRSPRLHFIHVFATDRASLPPPSTLPESGVPSLGEPFPYAREMNVSREQVARVFGTSFAEATAALPVGPWSEPIASSFGWHRVRIVERTPDGPARFEEVRKDVELDFVLARRAKVVGAYLKKLAGDYRIEKDGVPVTDFAPTRRVATRTDPSAED
jgi:hypothetical protein